MSDEKPVAAFMPQKGVPQYHLRTSTPEELQKHRDMLAELELAGRLQRGRAVAADRENERE